MTLPPAPRRPRCPGRAGPALALVAGAALVAPGASAQQPQAGGATELAAARALGIEGVKLADANNCAEAVSKLEKAERIHHAPTTLGRLGECHVQLGALVLGTELLQRVVREALPPNAPPPFVVAKARAQKVLEQALPKIAKLRITLKAPPEARPSVSVDGEPVASALLEVDRPTDPGAHRVEASAPGFRTAVASVTLREGGAESVALVLEPDPNAPRPDAAPLGPIERPGPAPDPGAAARGAIEAPEGMPTARVVAYSLLGVGAAGVIAGSVLGGLTLSKASDLKGQCPDKRCATPEAQDDLDRASRMGTWSTVAFGVGGAGLVGGLVLLLTAPATPAAPAARSGAPRPALRPSVGFGSIGLQGSF